MSVDVEGPPKRGEDVSWVNTSADPTAHAKQQCGHHDLSRNLLLGDAGGKSRRPSGTNPVQRRVVEPPAGHQHTPPITLFSYEGKESAHQRSKPISRLVGSTEPVTDPGVHPSHDPNLNGVEQTTPVAKVSMHQGPRNSGRSGHVLEGGEQRVVLREQVLRGINDEPTACVRVEPRRPGARWGSGGARNAQADAPAKSTSATDSPGDNG